MCECEIASDLLTRPTIPIHASRVPGVAALCDSRASEFEPILLRRVPGIFGIRCCGNKFISKLVRGISLETSPISAVETINLVLSLLLYPYSCVCPR